MGLIKQLLRAIKRAIRNIFGFITRRGSKRKRKARAQQPIKIPRSWRKKEGSYPQKSEQLIRIKHKKRIPGLWHINMILAGFWLFVNFVFSLVLLIGLGSQAQWLFLMLMGNCYFLIKYLWGSRKHEKR